MGIFSPNNLSKRENHMSITKSFFKVSLILALEQDYKTSPTQRQCLEDFG